MAGEPGCRVGPKIAASYVVLIAELAVKAALVDGQGVEGSTRWAARC